MPEPTNPALVPPRGPSRSVVSNRPHLLRILMLLSIALRTTPHHSSYVLAFEIPSQNSPLPPNDEPMLVAPGELVLTIVIMRHGDRTPQRHAPSFAAGDRLSLEGDRFPIDYTDWPVDYGQLTTLGMEQTIDMGRRLRHRYIVSKNGNSRNFLSRNYNHAETHVRSTDVDRTLVSAMNAMLGLYEEKQEQQHDESTTNNITTTRVIVPVHTVEYKRDALMDSSSKVHCPRFYNAGQSMMQTGFCKGAILRNVELLDALPALTGRDTSKLAFGQLVGLIAQLRDLRVYQRARNIPQPENVTRFDSALDDIVARIAIAKWDLTGLGVLVGGRLLRAVANRMVAVKNLVSGNQSVLIKSAEECNAMGSDSDEEGGCPRKLVLYCGHDTTIFDIRSALGLNAVVEGAHGGVAPYAAHVIFELRRRTISSRKKRRAGKHHGSKASKHDKEIVMHNDYDDDDNNVDDDDDNNVDVDDDNNVDVDDDDNVDDDDIDDDGDGDEKTLRNHEKSVRSATSPISLAEYTVTVLHGSHRQRTVPVRGPFCGGRSSCSMEHFLEYVNARVPADIGAACGVSDAGSTSRTGPVAWLLGAPFALVSSLVAATLAGGVMGYIVRGPRDNGRFGYQAIPN